MKVYLFCGEERKAHLLDVLPGELEALDFHAAEDSTPAEEDLVLVDLADPEVESRLELDRFKRRLRDGVRVLAILRHDQLKSLGRSESLDDFVLDGFTGEELRTRIRRISPNKKGARRGAAGLEIDEDRYQVRVDGSPVELTYKEFELLRFLASRPGKAFTREVLLEQVWGYDYFGGTRTVDVHIRRIRSKIEREGRTYIRTIRGVGYMFEEASPSA